MMRLSHNNSGAWKTIIEFPDAHLDAVMRATLVLARARTTVDRRSKWKISTPSHVHPGGATIWLITGGVPAAATWALQPSADAPGEDSCAST